MRSREGDLGILEKIEIGGRFAHTARGVGRAVVDGVHVFDPLAARQKIDGDVLHTFFLSFKAGSRVPANCPHYTTHLFKSQQFEERKVFFAKIP